MNKILLTLLAVVVMATAHAQSRAQNEAAITRFQNLYNGKHPDSIYYMMGEPGKSTFSADKARQAFSAMYQQLGSLRSFEWQKQAGETAMYKLVFEKTAMSLVISLNSDGLLSSFHFVPYKPDAGDDAAKPKSNFIFKSPTGNIYGTLTMPEGDKKVPAVLLIAGSGPTDRDCNSSLGLTSNAFLMLADSLQKAGIACVRYDKRGVAESMDALKDEESLTFDDYINDAIGFIKMLKEDPRFNAIYIAGHSEGSLIGMVAAQKEKVAGYISISGGGEALDDILVKQYTAESAARGKQVRGILDSIIAGQVVTDIDSGLFMSLRPSIQPYIRSLLQYPPLKEIKKLSLPILILQGTTDLQVSADNAVRLKKANPKATLQLIPGMNHVLKQAPEERKANFATYNDPKLPLSPGLAPAITGFILNKKS